MKGMVAVWLVVTMQEARTVVGEPMNGTHAENELGTFGANNAREPSFVGNVPTSFGV